LAASDTYLTTASIKKIASITRRSLVPGKPNHAQWLITRKCNYRCIGCNVWKEQDERELPIEDIKKGLDILKKIGVVDLVLSGGNPLLRSDMGEIIEYASKLFVTTVCDNGSMAAEKIDCLKNVDFVAISLDSLDEAKNDEIKFTPGAWKKSIEAIDLLQEKGINVAVTPTISQKNLYEIIDLTNYFTHRGIPVWYCLYSFDTSQDENQLFRIGKQNDDFVITDKQGMVKLCDELLKIKKKNRQVLMTKKLLKTIKSLYIEDKRTWKCQALNNFLVIDHLGRIAGCHSHNFAGTIFDLPEKWDSQEFKDLRKTYHECTQCNYLCYVFYSVQGSAIGNISVALDQWKNAKVLFK
jgi:MoaA/NifB/PqqE/SkfB family radical SAM enzyme